MPGALKRPLPSYPPWLSRDLESMVATLKAELEQRTERVLQFIGASASILSESDRDENRERDQLRQALIQAIDPGSAGVESEGLGPTAALGRELKQVPPSDRALCFVDSLARREADASASEVWLRLRSALEALQEQAQAGCTDTKRLCRSWLETVQARDEEGAMKHSDPGSGQREEGTPVGRQLPVSGTVTLAEALRLLHELKRGYGAQTRIDLDVRLHRSVRLDRAQICTALLDRGRYAYLCVDVDCPLVGTVVFAPREPGPSEGTPLHLGRHCALWPLSPPLGVDFSPVNVEQYARALLDELNHPMGDSAYRPEATWEFSEGGERP